MARARQAASRHPGRWVAGLLALALLAVPIRRQSVADAAPPPRDIILVLDVSRSMDDAFSRVIAAIETFLAGTRPGDTLTLSTFGDGVKSIVRQQPLGPASQPAVRSMLQALAPTDRFTNITYGVDRALSELIKLGPAEERLREIILLTDGKHNPAPGTRIPVPTFEELRHKAERFDPGQWYIRYLVLGNESDPDMTAFVRDYGGEATMLEHVLDERFTSDLTDTLGTAWLASDVTIEGVLGDVILAAVGQPERPAEGGAALREGDRLRLGPDSYALLRTVGGAHFGLNPETEWSLDQSRRQPVSGRVRVRGSVLHGRALATAADIPIVQVGLAGPQGGVHTAEGTVGALASEDGTTVAATEAGASVATYAGSTVPATSADVARPVVRPPGVGPAGAPRDPHPLLANPEPLPGGGYSHAQFLADWTAPDLYDRMWLGIFEGWRPTLETGAPLAAVPGAILVATQPPRLTDLVITDDGQFEGDVLSDDDNVVILQTDAGLLFFKRRDIVGISYAAFPLSSAKVEEIKGTAEFQRQGRTEAWRELIVGTKLRPGDAVKTGPDSRVICTVAGQAVLAIKADSILTIKDTRRDNSTGDIRARIKLDTGQLWNDVGTLASPRSRYMIETPQATSGVRGTVFTIVYDQQTEKTAVATIEGAVEVIKKEESMARVAVQAKRQARVEKAQEEVVTETIEVETVQEWEAQEEEFEDTREVMEIEYPPIHRVPVRATLTPSVAGPQRAGREVIWTAVYNPGALEVYEYEFALRGAGTDFEWTVVRPFARDGEWAWETGSHEGENLVRVRVRRADGEAMEDATTVLSYSLTPSYTRTILLAMGVLWLIAAVGIVVTQLAVDPRADAGGRLRVTEAPQGLPHSELALPEMSGLRWFHQVAMGRATSVDLTLGDETLALTQCRVRRTRFGPWMRATLLVEPGIPVYLDGTQVESRRARLTHMARIRLGEYEVRYETPAEPEPFEVVCRDGRVLRGAAPTVDLLAVPTLILQPREAGVPPHTVPFGAIEQIRCYRSRDEDERMRAKPGSAAVGGPRVQVWFTDSGEQLTGRLQDAADVNQGRFRVYTDETRSLDYVLVNGAATKRVKIIAGSERPPTFTPRDQVAGGRLRLGLATPGPTAVPQPHPQAPPERPGVERAKGPASEPESTTAADEEAAERTAEDPAADPTSDSRRYVQRRGKPRI